MLRRLFSFKGAKSQPLSNAAQGTIEYLIIIGAVVTISLVVVVLTISSTPSTTQLSTQSNNLQGELNELEIVDFAVNAGGNAALILKNNAGEKLTVTRVNVDGNNNHVFGTGVRINAGSKKVLVLNSLAACPSNTKKIYNLTVSYTSAHNLDKNAYFGNKTVSCATAISPSNTSVTESVPNLNEPQITWAAGGQGQSVQLNEGVTQYALSLTTNVSATCHYSLNSDTNYFAMTNFLAGTTTHTATVTGLVSGANDVYIRCKNNDTQVVNSTSFDAEIISGYAATNKYSYFYLDTNFNQQGALFNYMKLLGSNSGIITDANLLAWTYLPTGLTGLWHLDNNGSDSSGNGRTLTSHSVTYASGLFGTNAGNFTGSQWFSVPGSAGVGGLPNYSVSLWVKFDSLSSSQSMYIEAGPNGLPWMVIQYSLDNNLLWTNSHDGTNWIVAATITPSIGIWYNIVYTYDSKVGGIGYVNNVAYHSGATNYQNGSNASSIVDIGGGNEWWNGYYVHGKIEDVAVWNRTLNPFEVKVLYDKNAPMQNTGSNHYSDANYISPVFDTTSATTNFKSLSFNKSGLIYGAQINPALETDLNNGLVGLWHLNETAGTSFADSSGHGNNVACSDSCPTPTAGLWDTNAQMFDYLLYSPYLEKTGVANLPVNPTAQWTLSLWAKPDRINTIQDSIIAGWGNCNDNGVYLYGGNCGLGDTIAFSENGVISGYWDSCVLWDKGKWQHVVLESNGAGTIYIYKNGVGYSQSMPTPNTSSNILDIGGCFMNYQSFFGALDEVAIWNRALSATEVQNLFSKGSTKLGVEYRSCNDANCIGESWSDLNYSAITDVTISSIPQNEYFQYLVKPTYLDFPYISSESCISAPNNTSCEQWDQSIGDCSNYNYHNWQCWWQGESCNGDTSVVCGGATNSYDCFTLGGDYGNGMCFWDGDYCAGDATDACTAAATEEACNAVGVSFAGKSKESLAQKALFMGFKGNALENKVPRLNFATQGSVCYWDGDYCQVYDNCYAVQNPDICNNNVSGCYWNYGTCYQDIGCSALNSAGSETCDNFSGCHWDSSTYCYGDVSCGGQNSQSDIQGACNSIPGCQYNPSYGYLKMLSAYPVFKDFNLRYSN